MVLSLSAYGDGEATLMLKSHIITMLLNSAITLPRRSEKLDRKAGCEQLGGLYTVTTQMDVFLTVREVMKHSKELYKILRRGFVAMEDAWMRASPPPRFGVLRGMCLQEKPFGAMSPTAILSTLPSLNQVSVITSESRPLSTIRYGPSAKAFGATFRWSVRCYTELLKTFVDLSLDTEFTVENNRRIPACIGSNVTIDWTYDLQSKDLFGLQWHFTETSTQIMSKLFFDVTPVIDEDYKTRLLLQEDPLKVTLFDVVMEDAGEYVCNVLIRGDASMTTNRVQLSVTDCKTDVTQAVTTQGIMSAIFYYNGQQIRQNLTIYQTGSPFIYQLRGSIGTITGLQVTMETASTKHVREFSIKDLDVSDDEISLDIASMMSDYSDGIVKVEVSALQNAASQTVSVTWVEVTPGDEESNAPRVEYNTDGLNGQISSAKTKKNDIVVTFVKANNLVPNVTLNKRPRRPASPTYWHLRLQPLSRRFQKK
ncbi:hypothetical protein CAPTEDRAFT_206021 [Capitella teleta]|uniref:Ig-like domain-containing protein n=1 Tax=Capitella teleta TaxID=283909 RepID=R7U3W9_CAPTE|nr:hypothetical protein CAPTEDRAFT_206021 [Capitella teleta]|eukprot:ELU00684.1 hypothetical protein CAPTEDRAFT_206021 [Capitella teleta]